MNYLSIILPIYVLCGLSLADDAVFENKIPELLKGNPSIIIIGEDHKNSGLASGINKLLKTVRSSQNFNCLFLELPSDIQPNLDKAILKKDLISFSRTIYDSKISPTIQAYAKMGLSIDKLSEVEISLRTNQNISLTNFPFNQETLDFVFHEKINLLAYDEFANGPNTLGNTYYSIMDIHYPRDQKRDIENMRLANRRNTIMSKNIDKKFKQMNCEKAIVIVGFAHLYSNKYFNEIYHSDLVLSPLQDQLSQSGYAVGVLVAEYANISSVELTLIPDLQSRFSNFLGFLVTP